MTLLFAAYAGFCLALAVGFYSAMVLTAQEGED
jgi:hypothetical protein